MHSIMHELKGCVDGMHMSVCTRSLIGRLHRVDVAQIIINDKPRENINLYFCILLSCINTKVIIHSIN